MKDPPGRTKVVVRRLPPAITQSALVEQIDGRFGSRYNWICFRPGKASHKNLRYSRAYIDFNSSEDVIEFAEFFDGHIFVNERGTQFKASVEYAPSQCAPKSSKKDSREGTIFKDPEYLEFLEQLAKPPENLPSAEIQLERRDAERAGAARDTPIVTTLMDFVRKKRAAKSGPQRSAANGKPRRRSGGGSVSGSSPSGKRISERRRATTSTYVARDSSKNGNGREKSPQILISKRQGHHFSDKNIAASSATTSGKEAIDNGSVTGLSESSSAVSGVVGLGKKILSKGKEKETFGGLVQQKNTSTKILPGTSVIKPNQRREAGGRVIRSILSNKEGRQVPSYFAASQSELQIQSASVEDRRPPRPPSGGRLLVRDHAASTSSLALESIGNDLNSSAFISEKHKRTRNKDRPDRGVWTPLHRAEGLLGSNESLSSSLHMEALSDSLEAISASHPTAVTKAGYYDKGMKTDFSSPGRNAELRSLGGERGDLPRVESGTHRHAGRRGPPTHGFKEADSPSAFSEGKSSKRGLPGYASHHERQVWVQKSGSAS